MNRQEMIKYISRRFASWSMLIETLEDAKINGWALTTDGKGRSCLNNKGFPNIYAANCKFKKKHSSTIDAKGRYSCKNTKSFKAAVIEAKLSNRSVKSPRAKALISGEEYYMLDAPCKRCGNIHERHVLLPCTNPKSSTNDDIDLPKLSKSSTDFIKNLSVYEKKETTEKVEKTSNDFFSDVKGVVGGIEYSHISNDVKKALIELIIGGLS